MNVLQCNKADILLLLEIWLYDFDLHTLNSIYQDFYGFGLSAVDTAAGLLGSRSHSGVAVMRCKSLASLCSIIMISI